MATICLTGDLHHTSLGTGNQQHADKTELQIAREFLGLLDEYQVKATFFVSGLCFTEEWADMEPIAMHPRVELGGHNWNCLTPELLHRVSKKLFRSYNGPAFYQRWDAKRTRDIIEAKTGKRITAWRNHMYMHGPHTERVLAELGFRVCSDGTRKDAAGPAWHPGGLYNFPLNVMPDHEHLFHAERTPEWVEWWKRRYAWSDDWGPDSYFIDEWVERVLEDLERNAARGAVSNMIIHPITMYLCDGFKGVRKILEYLSKHESVHMGEVIDRTRGMP
ncbi:MAG: polysaccharide deacetylase family protein [Myxococcales bacterium]|nr:polysaccharide deacetylase family protein [Myxococcales bacterium]